MLAIPDRGGRVTESFRSVCFILVGSRPVRITDWGKLYLKIKTETNKQTKNLNILFNTTILQ